MKNESFVSRLKEEAKKARNKEKQEFIDNIKYIQTRDLDKIPIEIFEDALWYESKIGWGIDNMVKAVKYLDRNTSLDK